MVRRFYACALLLILLSACGGGGGGGGGASSASSGGGAAAPALTNLATITVDAGPASLATGPNAVIQDDVAYVSVTLCAPGTTNCQTIDHVQVDTGSVGLRVFQSVLNASLLAALPSETDASANPVGECFSFVDGYAFGSVRQADFQVGGEKVAAMPLQVVADTGVFSNVPESCSSGGGSNITTIADLGANGIIGIGPTTTDCGADCTVAGGFGAASYYDCPSSGCVDGTIARTAATAAPFQQLPNPVAAMSVDNNGTIIDLPAPAAGGQTSVTGTLYFGIGTQTNNGLGSAQVLTVTTSNSPVGAGFLTAIYNGQALPDSFLDSGSNFYIFVDNSITPCTGQFLTGYYCPASPTTLSPTLQGANGVTASAAFTLNNASILFNTSFSALPGIGGNPNVVANLDLLSTSFDFGLPFFYGRKVYTAIEGRDAGGTVGPYFAF